MNRKSLTIAATTATAVSSAVLVAKKVKNNKKDEKINTYRNTELGKYDKNDKGIYYTNGNYEAFARPKKPENVENKNAYLIGSGLASLAAACFLVRDGQMPGKNIHILEAMDIAGGACDGIFDPSRGYIMRGGREMENHFECLWDLFRSIPSLEIKDASVLDEFYWLNKEDPNYSLCRATINRGQDAKTNGQFNLSQKGCMEIMKLFMTKDEDLYDKTIEDVFDEEVFNSTFWMYWRTMFAFENWHSALEMKLYFQRFIHHISGLPDFSALKFTRYNQYESLILPMQKYLEKHGVDFQFNTEVTNVLFDIKPDKKVAKTIECNVKGKGKRISLSENDLVLITNGSCTEGTIYGDQNHAPNGNAEMRTSGCWNLWKNIAKQDKSFGHPEKFCSDIQKTNWESATVTTLDSKIGNTVDTEDGMVVAHITTSDNFVSSTTTILKLDKYNTPIEEFSLDTNLLISSLIKKDNGIRLLGKNDIHGNIIDIDNENNISLSKQFLGFGEIINYKDLGNNIVAIESKSSSELLLINGNIDLTTNVTNINIPISITSNTTISVPTIDIVTHEPIRQNVNSVVTNGATNTILKTNI